MKYSLLFSCIFLPLLLHAQDENNYWAFGHRAGIDFSQNPPVVFETELVAWEGGSVYAADAAGNKLFYSNGNTVWDAADNVMPNGNGIAGNGPASPGFPCSAAQGTLAAQSIAHPEQYYLFTLDAGEAAPYGLGKLRYSVIDMTLNGGLGDVAGGTKNIVLEDSLSEKMLLAPGKGCYYWLLVHHVSRPLYYAFRIDAGGINPVPVISTGILPGLMGIGMMALSPDATRVTMSHYLSGFEIATFDNATGIVSDARQFSDFSLFGMSSHCFSSDNTKLYLCRNNRLLQYNATLYPNVAALEASAVEIATGNDAPFGYMRRSPQGKIYIPNYNTPSLALINDPDNPGLACNYIQNGIILPVFTQFPNPVNPPSPYYGLGLGQDVFSSRDLTSAGPSSRTDTQICAGTRLTLTAMPDREYYLWQNGNSTPELMVDAAGTYWVHSWKGCQVYADTFDVAVVGLNNWGLGPDTTVCPGALLPLDAYAPEIEHYTWQDGSHTSGYQAKGKGIYTVTAAVGDCRFSDTLVVEEYMPYARILQGDTTICNDRSLTLQATGSPQSTYAWNTGATDPVLQVTTPGTYIVQASNVCGNYADTVTVAMTRCDCLGFVPNAFSPNGDGLNDLFELRLNCPGATLFRFRVFNRFGQCIFYSEQPGVRWDGYYKGQHLDAGTYFYSLDYKSPEGERIFRKGDILLIR